MSTGTAVLDRRTDLLLWLTRMRHTPRGQAQNTIAMKEAVIGVERGRSVGSMNALKVVATTPAAMSTLASRKISSKLPNEALP